MSDDRFFEELRKLSGPLRYGGDGFMRARIAARVRERIAPQPTVAHFLARWLRPMAASVGAIALVASIGMAWIEGRSDTASIESLSASNPVEISVAGDNYLLND